MNDKLSAECELFAQNRHDIGKAFKWEMEMEAAAAALVFTNAGVNADIEKMKEEGFPCNGQAEYIEKQ